jgi:hypothetical protein
MMLVGGYTKEGEARFGQVIGALPARRVPDAVKKVIGAYKADRQNPGTPLMFGSNGWESPGIKELVQEFTTLPPYAENPTCISIGAKPPISNPISAWANARHESTSKAEVFNPSSTRKIKGSRPAPRQMSRWLFAYT